MDRQELVSLIDRRLDELDISAAEASRQAVGNHYFIRNIRERDTNPTFDRLNKLFDVLGLEMVVRGRGSQDFELRPTTEGFSAETLPHRGLARCGVTGWGRPKAMEALPAPANISDADAFYVEATGHSMVPEGIRASDTVLVSPNTPPTPGARVYLEDREQRGAIKRCVSISDDTIELRGWMREGSQWRSFEEQRKLVYVTVLATVVAVYEHKPAVGERPVIRPDPTGTAQRAASVPLIGYAAAGNDIVFDTTFDDGERVPAPPSGGVGLGALAVRGNSMRPIARNGSTIHIDLSRRFMPSECIGDLVVARDRDGGAYLKTLRRGDDGRHWNLESADQRYETMVNVDIEQVFPVRWIGL